MADHTPHTKLETINELNFDERVLGADGPVLVDVSAAWCAPCRAAEPVVEALAAEHSGRLGVVKLDSEASPDLAQRLGVRGVPTFVLFDRGQEVARQVGYPGPAKLRSLVERAL